MKKKRKPAFPLLTTAIGAALILGIAAGGLARMYGAARQVVSAYGVAVCGLTHHVVLIYGDGRQRIVKGEAIISDKEVTEAVENLPPTKAGAFNICPPKAPPLKVY